MTLDELDKKIIEVKRRGLNILVETELIADLRSQYYEKLVERKLENISAQLRRNVVFLGNAHKQTISSAKIKEFMGINLEFNIHKIVYGDAKISSLKLAIYIAEFYGVPVEILLFQDLEANAETFKQLYPSLFRQSRD